MFLNYQDIAKNYTPNNLICSFPKSKVKTKLDPVAASKPYEYYDSKGSLVGYFWRYGESINLEFNIDGEIVVESNALVFHVTGVSPASTEGRINQRAYNVADLRSWTCTGIDGHERIWTEDDVFTYDESQSRSIYVSANDYLKNKQVRVTLHDFRHEPIYTELFEGSTKVIFKITPELSAKLKRGIYYCSLIVFDANNHIVVFDENDCSLLVK